MIEGHTPGSYLYAELRQSAGLSNREAARILLSATPIYNGRSPRDRVEERTFLSREVVHQLPDNVNPSIYGDFSHSAQTIAGRMVRHQGGGTTGTSKVLARYSGPAAQDMAALLDAYGRDGRVYRNTVRRVMTAPMRREDDRVVLLVMAFVVAGCLADPGAAARMVEQFTRRQLATDLVTMETSMGSGATRTAATRDSELLGLVRVVDGAVVPPIHELSRERTGTIIGSNPGGGSSITDVEVDVSRKHVVVWYQEGHWWCQGLGSTNGTALISGATKELVTVEPPRSQRRNFVAQPVEIKPGDTLCLGLNTRFLAVRMQG